jgi:hypothetical protein
MKPKDGAQEDITFTNYQQIVHMVFTNVEYTIIRKKEREENQMKTKMKKQNVKIEFDGKLYDRDLIVSYMRDDLREKLHSEWTDEKGGEQEFFEAYCELLRNETGEEFEI